MKQITCDSFSRYITNAQAPAMTANRWRAYTFVIHKRDNIAHD